MLHLRQLSKLYPNTDAAVSRIAFLRARQSLPKKTIHVISDIHGEDKKLRHIINNGSGSLRLLVDEAFGATLGEEEKWRLLSFIHYPLESFALLGEQEPEPGSRAETVKAILHLEIGLLRRLAGRYTLAELEQAAAPEYRPFYLEAIFAESLDRDERFIGSMVDELIRNDGGLKLLRTTARLLRNLLISELVIAGDLGDRGPRIDKVISFLMRQPNVAFTWGNHDAVWMGACLGHEACIATVLRVSLRYRRLSQLEEGYGIITSPLEKLARDVYADDDAARFKCKGEGLRDDTLMRRMQKAIAIIQFKLEGELTRRNPHFEMEDRNLLHRIDPARGIVTIDGTEHPMLDSSFPTIDFSDPYRLSPEESQCLARLRQSFLESRTLWQHMQFVLRRGAMHLVRDGHLIFHACVPADENGELLPFAVDGVEHRGRALFDAIGKAVARSFREKRPADLDLLWYLWAGARSPWFGKDKMATFEGYFVEDPAAQKETKNAYFKLIHEPEFCRKVLREFGVDAPHALIVNGHVPVKIEQGESPLKKSKLAVTIDGAFSEAYGDKGYTLIIDPNGTFLAQHHHFESVQHSITEGRDIIPQVAELRLFDAPRRVFETPEGSALDEEIAMLEALIRAYQDNLLPELESAAD